MGSHPRLAAIARAVVRLTAAAAMTLVLLEVVLRLFHHEILPAAVSNEVAMPYYVGFGGLYDWDPEINFTVFKPHYTRSMYMNGYRWQHQGDALGFRNPVDRDRADVVLIGDSMIYGHGVEETHTVRHELEERLRRPVVNLGMQAGSGHSAYQFLKRYAVAFHPRYVFVFFLKNDIADVAGHLSDEDMERFLAAPAEQRDVDYFPRYESDFRERCAELLRGFYSLRAIYIAGELLRQAAGGQAHAAALPPLPPSFRKDRRLAPAMAFHLMALKRMALIAADHGATFVHVFIYSGQEGSRAEEAFYEALLEHHCRDEGIEFVSLRPALAQAIARGDEPFLPNDGHFGPLGAAITADVLAQWIAARERAPPVAAAR